MKYINYFWDFDGTLYDTYPGMVTAFAQTFAKRHVKLDKYEIYQLMRKDSVRATFQRYGKDFDLSDLRQDYQNLEQLQQVKAHYFANADEVCRTIKENGGRNFLLTHRDRSALEILKRDNLFDYFDDFITSEDDFPRKPDPDSLLYLINKHDLVAEKSVMIGDRGLDVEAGHNAHMAGILFDPDKLLSQTYHADKVVTELKDILA